jgi:PadR family transcriptional regulator PadR
MFRRPGVLLPLERRILEIALSHAADGVYGFALAKELADERGTTRLIAHGTLYKALGRLSQAGLLTAEWEEASIAQTETRPRRRVYRVTAQTAAACTQTPEVGGARWGEQPA